MALHHTEALMTATTTAATAVTVDHFVFDIGLPIPELLCAFAGAALVLSWIEDEHSRTRTFLTIIFCALLGTWFCHPVARYLGVDGLVLHGVAFGLGAAFQVFTPVVIENRNSIMRFITRRKED